MSPEMIAVHLDQKIKNWLATLPEPLALFLEDKVFIAGGAIASLLADEEPRDYDFFFTCEDAVERIKQHYLAKGFELLETVNALTFTADKIQLVTRRYGPPGVLVNQFDWVHTTGYVYQGEFRMGGYYRMLAEKKILAYNRKCLHPFHALYRLPKFIRRGYSIDLENLTALAQGLQTTDLDDEDEMRGLYPFDLGQD